MKLIKEIQFGEEKAKMFLLDDKETIQIVLGTEVVSTSKNVWNNIKDEEWAQYGLLKIETESYIKKKNAIDNLKHIAEEFFKQGDNP